MRQRSTIRAHDGDRPMTAHEPALLSPASLAAIQAALASAGVDGWLLYDFRGTNPIARAMVGLEGMGSRRIFAWVPTRGTPVGISHAIEQLGWAKWPRAWDRRVYASWRSLEREVASLVAGKRVAMEYSPGDAVPVVDRIPAGVLEMVRAAGATVVTSADLVTRFFAVWSDAGLASHKRAAEQIARIAHEAFARAGAAARTPRPIAEHELMQLIRGEFATCGLATDHGPNVSATENAANPHYEPTAAAPRLLREGDAILIDLWATEPGGIYADQTWMATVGAPSKRLSEVWTAVRDARDAALELLTTRVAAGTPIRGADVDDAARAVSGIIAPGIIPAALERMDNPTIRAVEASIYAAGYPIDAAAILLCEVDGLAAGLSDDVTTIEHCCRESGARDVRVATTDDERTRLWQGRKKAFGAMGRIAPSLVVQDAVVPRTRLPEILRTIHEISVRHNVKVCNVFHAGDGNLHPNIPYDASDPDESARVHAAMSEIMVACIAAGGTITGEHGVGLDKLPYMPKLFDDDSLAMMCAVRDAFDPMRRANPGKVVPVHACREWHALPAARA